ncbi:hypothetical protein [Sphingomonas edaphi]|nr:hypothetical protein [Sphingomonas edaphi]
MSKLAQPWTNKWRIAGWGIALGLVLLPLAAMQFTREVNWTSADFVFAAALIGGVGALYEFTVRRSASWAYRGGVAAALAASFLTIWVNGAVGMIGSEDNPYNLVFLGVIVLALSGSVVTRFRASGMALALAVAAVAQAIGGLAGMNSDLRGGLFSTGFALIWLLSAALFHNAAQQEA